MQGIQKLTTDMNSCPTSTGKHVTMVAMVKWYHLIVECKVLTVTHKKGEYSSVNHVNKQEYSLNCKFDNYVK